MDSPKNEKFLSLVGDLQTDIKNLIKKEFELAKTEMGEKFKVLGRNATFMAVGGVIALMAVLLLLIGLAALFAQLIELADVPAGYAYFIGFFGLGIVLAIAGYGFIQKALHAFGTVSLTPDKTLSTAKGEEVPIHVKQMEKSETKTPKRSSDDLQHEVESARDRMENEMVELKNRLTPKYMAKSFVAGMKHHPMRAVVATAVTTGFGGLIYWHNHHQAKAAELQRKHFKRRAWLFKLGRA
jgi:hypothetical protein